MTRSVLIPAARSNELVSHNEATLVQYGTIDDGINNLFYPSLAVDKHGTQPAVSHEE